VAETGLGTLLELLNNLQKCDASMLNAFYQSYYLGLLQDTFSVLTDTLHKPGFKLQAMILAHLFLAVESNAVTAPLWPQDGSVAASSNGEFLRNHLLQMLSTAFPHLTQAQLTTIIGQMFQHCKDHAAFKQHLRDVLVQIKEFGDSTELYADEARADADLRAKELRTRQEAIPGIINPHARTDDMMGD